MKVLIRNGADVNTAMKDKWTALLIAAGADMDVMKELVQNGADVNAVVETNGRHHFVAQDGYVDVVKVLIQKGADVNAVNGWKETPLTAQLRMDILTLRKSCFRTVLT